MKVPEYVTQDVEILDFIDKIRNVLNYGKYQIPVIDFLPNWEGKIGEFVIFQPTSAGHTQYVFINTAWVSTWSVTL